MLAVGGEDTFEPVRAKAALGQLVIVRPDGQYLFLPALHKDRVGAEMVATVERMLALTTRRIVAVIGDTTWATGDAPTLQTANHAIPFFDYSWASQASAIPCGYLTAQLAYSSRVVVKPMF